MGNISPSVDPSDRNVAFGELVDTHLEQTVGLLIDGGGGDILPMETIFDTLNERVALSCSIFL